MSELLFVVPAALTLGVAILVLVAPRFGAGSWMLSWFLALPAIGFGLHSLVAETVLSFEWKARIAYALLVAAFPAALRFLWAFGQPDYRAALRKRRIPVILVAVPAPLLAALLLLERPVLEISSIQDGTFVALGPGGYLASVYLLALSVLSLAHIEQIVRGSDEGARWKIKFLMLGLAASFASVLYLASRVLLYSFSYALLPLDSLSVLPVMSLVASVLILVSWRRSAGGGGIRISQTLAFSSITLLAVGVYLIVSSLLARWASLLGQSDLELEALVFLLAAVAMGLVLFWTSFRQRVRQWLRRNIFSGRYDYRQYWMQASEKIRSIDDPKIGAAELAHIVHSALGAIDVTVWLRLRDPNRLSLLSYIGNTPETGETAEDGIVLNLLHYKDVFGGDTIDAGQTGLRDFAQKTRAALLVPLLSSDRLVGVMTVGSDRSGRPYDRETREFLRVLGGHAAGELHKWELLATLVEAKEAEAFRTFSTFLLHDLKNFASTLSLVAGNATRHRDNPDFQKDAFQSVHDTAGKMKRLCNSLKTFSATLAADRKLQDINRLVRDCAAGMLDGDDRVVTLQLSEVPPVLMDSEEIGRVLQNLVLNSREATSAGDEIVIRTARVNERVELAVIDRGRGMTPEFLQKELFHPFHTTKSDGLGIGLFQCKRIVEAHRGSIAVESQIGKGTTVRILLPCRA